MSASGSGGAPAVEVVRPGLQTIVVDWPGRIGQWSMGIPPSGPADDYSFRLGNRLLGNPEGAAGIEVQFVGPTLRFRADAEVCLTGADTPVRLDGVEVPAWEVLRIPAGAELTIGACATGARCYLLVAGGLVEERFLGSVSTFVKGGLGATGGRALQAGDILAVRPVEGASRLGTRLSDDDRPRIAREHDIEVLAGPHEDRLGPQGCKAFLASEWSVLPASDRTGIRLSGPEVVFREDLLDADMHPSNVIDFPYCVGSISLSGDTPIIYPVDGPSLGGFMCPFTIVRGALWKTGQLRPGDRVRFVEVDADEAAELLASQQHAIRSVG